MNTAATTWTCTITDVIRQGSETNLVCTDHHRRPQAHVAYNPSRGPLKKGDTLEEDPTAPGLLQRRGDFA